jgi:CBS domain-containing protein
MTDCGCTACAATARSGGDRRGIHDRQRPADIMCTLVVIAADTEDSAPAIERMRTHGVRRIPVVGAGGGPVGIVTLDDLLKVFATDVGTLLDIVAKGQSREHRARR